jgi:hypothetical protein
MLALNAAQSARLDALFDQLRRAWDAGDRVTNAPARPARTEPDNGRTES